MNRSNHDIWAVQGNSEEIYKGLEGVESSYDNTLFENCISFLKVGERRFKIQFNIAFYSRNADKLILLRKSGKFSEKKFKRILDEKGIAYSEVHFLKARNPSGQNPKPIWFAREADVLDTALKNSRAKGIDTCDYYPDIQGRLEMRYLVREGKVSSFDCQDIRGVIVLKDKIVLFINNDDERNIYYLQALKLLQKNDFAPDIHLGVKKLPKESIPKQYKKEH